MTVTLLFAIDCAGITRTGKVNEDEEFIAPPVTVMGARATQVPLIQLNPGGSGRGHDVDGELGGELAAGDDIWVDEDRIVEESEEVEV